VASHTKSAMHSAIWGEASPMQLQTFSAHKKTRQLTKGVRSISHKHSIREDIMEKSRENINENEPAINEAPERAENEKIGAQEEESKENMTDFSLANVQETLNTFEEKVASHFLELMEAFERKIALDRFKEEQIRQLHNELQSYKADLLAKAMRPLVTGMIRLHEDMGKMVEFYQKSDEQRLEREGVLKNLEGCCEDLITVLDQNGIIAYKESGDEFNPRRQRILRRVPTSDPERVGQVAESLRFGFEQGDMMIQKEAVAVYVFAEDAPSSTPSSES
jgi:molecular chaperone GrpE